MAARISPLIWVEVAMVRNWSIKCVVSGSDPALSWAKVGDRRCHAFQRGLAQPAGSALRRPVRGPVSSPERASADPPVHSARVAGLHPIAITLPPGIADDFSSSPAGVAGDFRNAPLVKRHSRRVQPVCVHPAWLR